MDPPPDFLYSTDTLNKSRRGKGGLQQFFLVWRLPSEKHVVAQVMARTEDGILPFQNPSLDSGCQGSLLKREVRRRGVCVCVCVCVCVNLL